MSLAQSLAAIPQLLSLQRRDLESKPISNSKHENMDGQAVNVRPTLPLEVDQPPLFSGYSIPQSLVYICLLISHQCNKTPGCFHTSLQGAPRGGTCCSQTGNLSTLISFLEILLIAFVPKEKTERGRCKGNKSHNQSR